MSALTKNIDKFTLIGNKYGNITVNDIKDDTVIIMPNFYVSERIKLEHIVNLQKDVKLLGLNNIDLFAKYLTIFTNDQYVNFEDVKLIGGTVNLIRDVNEPISISNLNLFCNEFWMEALGHCVFENCNIQCSMIRYDGTINEIKNGKIYSKIIYSTGGSELYNKARKLFILCDKREYDPVEYIGFNQIDGVDTVIFQCNKMDNMFRGTYVLQRNNPWFEFPKDESQIKKINDDWIMYQSQLTYLDLPHQKFIHNYRYKFRDEFESK